MGKREGVAWLLVAAWGLGASGAGASEAGEVVVASAGPLFVDGTAATGLHAVHDNGAAGRLELLAIMGPGAALFDYDLDGDLDLYLPVGGPLPGDPAGGARPPAGRLLRNDLVVEVDGRFMPRWVDVTATAGLTVPGYAMGAAVGDVDGDGSPDLFVPVLGRDLLWRNRGDGTFGDVSSELGSGASWSVAGSFFDADGDGDLDLYVVRYVVPTAGVRCFAESTRPDYCGPAAYAALPDRLLRNRGEGTFDDVSVPSGVGRVAAPGLGAIAGDFDGDGSMDLYVANDGEANFLWRSRGDHSFADEGPMSGTALSREGLPQAGMGVDAADADGDLEEDLFVTHLTGETNTLYQRTAPGVFSDRTAAFGLAAPSLPWTGFGTGFVDADLDGRLDLVVVNGAVRLAHTESAETASAPRGAGLATGPGVPAVPTETGPAGAVAAGSASSSSRLSTAAAAESIPAGASADELTAHHHALAQPAQLYRNLGDGFVSLSAEQAGPALTAPAVARGLAIGDVDGDGDEDLVVAVNGGAARLLLASPSPQATWVAVAACPGVADAPWLVHRMVARSAATGAGDAPAAVVRRPRRDGGYASARQPRALVGLGGAAGADVEVMGPAATLRWRGAPAGRTLLWCPAREER